MTKNIKQEIIEEFDKQWMYEPDLSLQYVAKQFLLESLDKYKNFIIENAPQKKGNMPVSSWEDGFHDGYSEAIDDFIEVIKNN